MRESKRMELSRESFIVIMSIQFMGAIIMPLQSMTELKGMELKFGHLTQLMA